MSTTATAAPNPGERPGGRPRSVRWPRRRSEPRSSRSRSRSPPPTAAADERSARFEVAPTAAAPAPGAQVHAPGDELAEHGPARMTDGIAQINPNSSVRPRSAVQGGDRHQRAGVRRDETVQDREAGQRGNTDPEHRGVRAPGGEQHDRHQQDDADLEEQRDADQRGDARHRPRQARGSETRSTTVPTMRSAPPESASSLPIMAPSAMSSPTLPTVEPTPLVKLVIVLSTPRPDDDPQHCGTDDQGQEGMRPSRRDQHDHGADAQHRGHREDRVVLVAAARSTVACGVTWDGIRPPVGGGSGATLLHPHASPRPGSRPDRRRSPAGRRRR